MILPDSPRAVRVNVEATSAPSLPDAPAKTFPFTAVLGQDELKHALLLTAIDPGISGVLAFGDRGTAKSTTVRGMSDLLSEAGVIAPVVDLPLGVSEDRLLGAIDVETALATGRAEFKAGLLAAADGGYLYIDEVNLLDDYIIDLLLDVAASGVNHVERDGLSHQHSARFVLIGSGNPEEGELRPQLEDRFGLSTHVRTVTDVSTRVEIVRRRMQFDADPVDFCAGFADSQQQMATTIASARDRLEEVEVDDRTVTRAVELCSELGAVGHRAEITLVRAARATAALRGARVTTDRDLGRSAVAALRHRIPREPFEPQPRLTARVRNRIVSTLGQHWSAA
ncbi:ATP-binding protein [Rhodococcus sp. NPDC058521]|uniref:ATP-binding protein n=1 Tax=Rhodococcus sp. NPDC058521 TaxID=3346536 RepID=UPI0036526D52